MSEQPKQRSVFDLLADVDSAVVDSAGPDVFRASMRSWCGNEHRLSDTVMHDLVAKASKDAFDAIQRVFQLTENPIDDISIIESVIATLLIDTIRMKLLVIPKEDRAELVACTLGHISHSVTTFCEDNKKALWDNADARLRVLKEASRRISGGDFSD